MIGLAILAARPAAASDVVCPPPDLLPAYAHNDYDNREPFYDALRRGFRGVEADVFLIDGELRVAHDRDRVRPGRTLRALYLDPMRQTREACAGWPGAAAPFLLNVELKEESPAAYDSLCALLRRYPDLVASAGADAATVEVVLVGWHPPVAEVAREPHPRLRLQSRLTSLAAPVDTSAAVRLVSLNYGKTIRWPGGSPPPPRARRWLAQLQRARAAAPGRITRVYNVPPRREVYRLLLDSGVDLVGTEDLPATQRVLQALR